MDVQNRKDPKQRFSLDRLEGIELVDYDPNEDEELTVQSKNGGWTSLVAVILPTMKQEIMRE